MGVDFLRQRARMPYNTRFQGIWVYGYGPQPTIHLSNSSVIAVCAMWQIQDGLKTYCLGTGQGRMACTFRLAFKNGVSYEQKLQRLAGSVHYYWQSPLWFWLLALTLFLKIQISTTTCTSFHIGHAFYLSHQYFGLLLSSKSSCSAYPHPTCLSPSRLV